MLPVGSGRLSHCAFRLEVGGQRKVQMALSGKGFVASDAVHRDADELRPVLLELRADFVIERHLVAADRTPVGGVEG